MGAEEQEERGVTLLACTSLSIETSNPPFETVPESSKGMSIFLEL
jgi:hypothetical protein